MNRQIVIFIKSTYQMRKMKITCLYSLLFLITSFWATAQNPTETIQLVKDINASGGENRIEHIIKGEDFFYFVHNDGIHGEEFWISNGTKSGTKLLKDIMPGSRSSSPLYPRLVGNKLYFFTLIYEFGLDLWVSDGTEVGTQKVKNINSEYSGAYPTIIGDNGNELFFRADDGTHGFELWKSDGTATGTQLIKDMSEGTASSSIYNFTLFKDDFLFIADTPEFGQELWRSDGTETGTNIVKDIGNGSLDGVYSNMLVVGDNLFFSALTPERRYELWRSDGTAAGTVKIIDEIFYSLNSKPFLTANNLLYFIGGTSDFGKELWVSDGTEMGTKIVKDMTEGQADTYFEAMLVHNDVLYFSIYSQEKGGGLWKTNGTSENTINLTEQFNYKDYAPLGLFPFGEQLIFFQRRSYREQSLTISDGTIAGTKILTDFAASAYIRYFTVVNNQLFFAASDEENGFELWKMEVSSGSMNLVKDIYPGPTGSVLNNFFAFNDQLIFTADSPSTGFEFWRSDGTTANTFLIADIYKYTASSEPYILGIADDFFFFSRQEDAGRSLWRSDGTSNGTYRIIVLPLEDTELQSSLSANQRSGSSLSFSSDCIIYNNVLYFAHYTRAKGRELWRSDGTAEGTFLLKDINDGTGSSSPNQFVIAKGEVFFIASDDINGKEVWKTNGTTAGTHLVKAIYNGGRNVVTPYGLVAANDLAFFIGYDDDSGFEVWRTDGTEAGTHVLKNLKTWGIGDAPSALVAFQNQLFFGATYDAGATALWRSDGTEVGTHLVKSFEVGRYEPLRDPVVVDETLYFVANESDSGNELWQTDGTTEGTQLVIDLYPGYASGAPNALRAAGNKLYFIGRSSSSGYVLWQTDGTEMGTKKISSDLGIEMFSSANFMTYHQGYLYFTFDDGLHGQELWRTDGSPTATRLVQDLNPTEDASAFYYLPNVKQFTTFNNDLYFTATNGINGRELFKLGACPEVTTSLVADQNSCENSIILPNHIVDNYQTSWSVVEANATQRLTKYEAFTVVNDIANDTILLKLKLEHPVCPTVEDTIQLTFRCFRDSCQKLVITNNYRQLTIPDTLVANEAIISTDTIEANTIVNYIAGNSITLNSGFHAKSGALFHASIEGIPCRTTNMLEQFKPTETFKVNNFKEQSFIKAGDFEIFPNPINHQATINFLVPQPANVSFELFDLSGKKLRTILSPTNYEQGNYQITYIPDGLETGLYLLSFSYNAERKVRKVVINN